MAELMSHSSSVTLLSRGSSSAPSSTLSLFEMEEAWHNRATCLLTPELSDKTENVFSKALHRFLSLRVLLLVFGCLFVLASGLVVFGICLAAGTSSVALTEASLQRSIAVSIVNEVISFLTTAYTGVNELGEQLRLSALRGYLSIRDTNATRIREVMLPIVRQFVPSLYIGFPTGYFVGYNNIGSANGEFVLTQSLFVGAPNRTRYFTDPLGEPLANIPNSTAMFNSSLRPWYRQCAQAKAPRFTDVYTFANIASLGITATFPIFEDLQPPPFYGLDMPSDVRPSAPIPDNRTISSVIGADLSLLYLNQFLESLEIGLTGEAFILDMNGYFLASSVSSRVIAKKPDFTLVFSHSTAMLDAVVNATMEVLIRFNLTTPINRNNFSDYRRLTNVTGMTVSANGNKYRGSVTTVSPVSWVIVILIPYADYVIPAEQLFFVSLYVALAIVVMATAGFFVFGIVVTRPITGIARSMEAITKELVFDDDRYTRGSSHLAEISSMLESFSRLRFGLQSFSRYVPLSVVRTLMQSNSSAVLGVESCVATPFFSDIEGFTSISERVSPPVLVTLLEEYFTKVSEIVFKTNGLVIDYFGDAVLASWNAPLLLSRHQSSAVKSALLQQRALEKLREGWAQRGMPELRVRMGLTTGPVVAGNVGSKFRMKYTLMGDSVNLAARLESLNKLYGTYLMICGALHEHVRDEFVCKLLDNVAVVGKGVSTMVYEVLTERTGEDRDNEHEMLRIEALSKEAFAAYQSRKWEVAKALYKQLGGKHGDVFLDRIAEFEVNPPAEEWSGVTILSNK